MILSRKSTIKRQ